MSKKVLLFKLLAVVFAIGVIAGLLHLRGTREGKKSVLFPPEPSRPRIPIAASPTPTPPTPPTPTPRPQVTQLPAFGPGFQARIEEAQRLADQKRRQDLNRQFLQILTQQRERLERTVAQEIRKQMLDNPHYAARLDEKYHTMKNTLPALESLLKDLDWERQRVANMLELNADDFRFPIEGEGIILDLLNQNFQLPPGEEMIDPEIYAAERMKDYDLSLDRFSRILEEAAETAAKSK